ncbi:unnamed protein product [Lactuca saligna]|uniref:Uncharacterized protein n=1 Tax=Lactuca saligna TaxID=75948 RepID=A0AA35Z5S4_LACSI|nr:unnamed protein product [Lactuca saligna]
MLLLSLYQKLHRCRLRRNRKKLIEMVNSFDHEAFDHHVTYSVHYSATRKIKKLWWKKRKEEARELRHTFSSIESQVMPNLTGPVADGRDGIISLFVSFSELIIQKQPSLIVSEGEHSPVI